MIRGYPVAPTQIRVRPANYIRGRGPRDIRFVSVKHSNHVLSVDFTDYLQGFLYVLNTHVKIVVRFHMGIWDVQNVLVIGDETAYLVGVGLTGIDEIVLDFLIQRAFLYSRNLFHRWSCEIS